MKQSIIILLIAIVSVTLTLFIPHPHISKKHHKLLHVDKIKKGIAFVESNDEPNPYKLKAKPAHNGDRALGKYQIMGSNIKNWSKEALGYAITKEEYLNSPVLQEAIVGYQIQQLVQSGASDEDIACIWFSGRPCKQAGNAQDSYGTSVKQYVHKFLLGMNDLDD